MVQEEQFSPALHDTQPLAELSNKDLTSAPPDRWKQSWNTFEGGFTRNIENSPALSSVSMELTNDTFPVQREQGYSYLQRPADHDSGNIASVPPERELTYSSITDDVPGLSTLVEEDAEADMDFDDDQFITKEVTTAQPDLLDFGESPQVVDYSKKALTEGKTSLEC